tara:strand:- start:3003 stop:5420 length:2418 start_codon:yes stop_codon:yes gene_type:complete
MPKQMVTLNDFSGGLNTKTSPRDIKLNESPLLTSAIINNPGTIKSSSSVTSKDGSVTAVKSVKGNGAFYFNLQNDIGRTSGSATDYEVPVQVIAYPSGTNVTFFTRAFGNTGDWTHQGSDNQVAVGGTTTIEPVYYFVDGTLYISDKRVVEGDNSTNPKAIQFIDTARFTTAVAKFVTGDTIVGPTDADTLKTIGNTGTQTTPADAGDIDLAFDPSPTQQNLSDIESGSVDIVITGSIIEEMNASMQVTKASSSADISGVSALAVGKTIYLNSEAVIVTSKSGTTTLTLGIERGQFGTSIGEHAVGTILKSSSDDPIGGGSWPEGTYEFCHTLVNYTGDETLPSSPESDTANLAVGDFFSGIAVRINIEAAFREREKGFRIYTRIKDNNDRWGLFVDADYERGARTSLFEDYKSWALGSGDAYADGGTNSYAEVTAMTSKSPSLDTYESITGYSQEEKLITFGSDGGYKAATVCSRRAWVANVRKNNVVYDDRIYYTPVNRFATFPDSFYLDIGISDGDSFTALHSFGNKLLAFKQQKLYVINVSSTSDAGWYIESQYDGMGCLYQEAVTRTPYGVAWTNEDGVYIYTGEGMPVEITEKLDNETWTTNTSAKIPSIAYNSEFKQLMVLQDTAASGDNSILIYDFQTRSLTFQNRVSVVQSGGLEALSNFVETFDGTYAVQYDDDTSSNAKTIKKFNLGDYGSEALTLQTKDMDFGSPGKVKKVYKLYITARTAGSSTNLVTSRASDGNTTFGNASTLSFSSANYAVSIYTVDTDCESMSFKFVSNGKIEISDIVVEYREKYKRAS